MSATLAARLLARIHRRYQTKTDTLQIGQLKIPFTRIADPDVVLDQVAAEEDRREKLSGQRDEGEELHLPYWAELWPSGLALARHYGADVEALRKALLISSCANGPLEKWGTQTMAWAEDDMAIVAEMAAEAGIALPQAGVNREICRTLKPKRYKLDLYGR